MGRRGRGAEMCDWAYHHEALRKARVLERKREAEGRIAREQSMHCGRPAETMDRPPVNQDIQSNYDVRRNNVDLQHDIKKYECDRELSELRLQDVTRDQIYPVIHPADRMKPHDHSREGPVSRPTHYQISKELRHQEKVLRNHNLVMGPMDAFKEYFHPNANYGPPRQ